MLGEILTVTAYTVGVTGAQVATREYCKKKFYHKDMSKKAKKKADKKTDLYATVATVGAGIVGMGITGCIEALSTPSDTTINVEVPVEVNVPATDSEVTITEF